MVTEAAAASPQSSTRNMTGVTPEQAAGVPDPDFSKPTVSRSSTADTVPDAEMAIRPALAESIYDLYNGKRRNIILAAVSVASIAVPFCDTIYLPALQAIQIDLNTNAPLVAASVAIYLFLVGIFALVWGPASDMYGRRIIYFASFVAFLASSIVCIFAPNIGVLVAFRALQGAAVSAFLVTGSSVVADIYPPAQRGAANGMFMIPLLIGPIIGPLLGGGLAQAFGWRSTFICLTVFGAVLVPLIFFAVPETTQYKVLQQLRATDPAAATAIKEAPTIEASPPVFHAPWVPLRYLLEPEVAPHGAMLLMTFGSMFASLTEFPVMLAKDPYNFSMSIIGVAFLPVGVAGFLASPIAGHMSDASAAKNPDEPEARLIHNTLLSLIFMPPGLFLYAWSLQYTLHIAVPLVATALIGIGCSVYLPGIFGYISSIKQADAGAATGAMQSLMFVAAGTLVVVSSVAVQAIGIGPFFTILAGLQMLVNVIAYVLIWRKRQASKVRQQQQQQEIEQVHVQVVPSKEAAA